MWQRFSEKARKVVFYAQEEAQKTDEGFVDTHHLLLGFFREECVATRVMDALGATSAAIRLEIEKRVSAIKLRPSEYMTLTPACKKVIDVAYDEARQLGKKFIGTEHLLLGMLGEKKGIAGQVLTETFGIDIDRARQEVKAAQAITGAGTPTDGPSLRDRAVQVVKGEPEPAPAPPIDHDFSRTLNTVQQEAFEDARARGLRYIGTHDYLWAILNHPEASATRALVRAGVDIERLKTRFEKLREIGPPIENAHPADSPFSRISLEESKQVLTPTLDRHITTGHLLLGMYRKPGLTATNLLANLEDVSYEHLFLLLAQDGKEP